MATPTLLTNIATVKTDLTWLQKHETLIIVFMLSIVFLLSIGKVETILAQHAATKAVLLQTQLDTQKAVETQLAATAAQTAAQYQNMVNVLTAQNAALAGAITSQNKALVAQKGVDAQLPPSGLANRIQALANAPQGSVEATANGVNLLTPGAVAVTQTLEEVPVLTANLADESKIAGNKTAELAQANDLVSSLNEEIGGLKTQIKDSDKACNAQISDIKKKSRVSKLKWFGVGVGAGMAIIARLVI